MSTKRLMEMLQAAETDDRVRTAVDEAADWQELKAVAGELGYDLGGIGEDEASKAILDTVREEAKAHPEALTDDELSSIAGGLHVVFDAPSTSGGTRGIIYGIERLFSFRSRLGR